MSPRLWLLRFLRRWHARIGFAAVLFFLILAVTGFVLNHASGLRLDAKYLHAAWLARWYGLKIEPPRHAPRARRGERAVAARRPGVRGEISAAGRPCRAPRHGGRRERCGALRLP